MFRNFPVYVVVFLFITGILILLTCSNSSDSEYVPPEPVCEKTGQTRTDAHTPQTMVADWSQPIKVALPINNFCPQDAIEISADGQYLYYMHTEDLLESLTPAQILSDYNNTYRAERIGDPGEFGIPEYYNLAKGTAGSLDGELSFTSDGSGVYFQSNRPENTGYQNDPFYNDYIDIYYAEIIDSVPGMAVNLGPQINSVYPDGEHALHPDGVSLYFTSLRPGGTGGSGSDIYVSTKSGGTWSTPVNLGSPINSAADDLQPAFTADGDTMYFTSSRNPIIGAAIYRSVRSGDVWGIPELVIRGVVGEASLTADGQLLYFVHVLSDAEGNFDADIYYCTRVER